MRIVRSTVLRLLNDREARLVLGSAPACLIELSLTELRRRAEEARSARDRYAEIAARLDQETTRSGRDAAQRARDTATKAELFGESAERYENAAKRRQEQLRRAAPAKAPRGVAVLSITGERIAPGVTSARSVRVVRKPARATKSTSSRRAR